MDEDVEIEEYCRMAAVEDEMWYYRALHGHLERALTATFGGAGDAAHGLRSPDGAAPASARRLQPRILDAGCGTGGLIRRLERTHPEWHWTGVDLEPVACGLARSRVAAAEIVEAAVTALPFANECFDAVVTADVLYHVDDDAQAIREAARVLRPGGRIIINVPAHRWLWSYHDVAVHARRRYVRSELDEKLRAAGLRVERLTHWNALPLPLVFVRRKLLPGPRGGSDVHRYPRAVEVVFDTMMVLERAILRRANLPFGSSILAVARKSD